MKSLMPFYLAPLVSLPYHSRTAFSLSFPFLYRAPKVPDLLNKYTVSGSNMTTEFMIAAFF